MAQSSYTAAITMLPMLQDLLELPFHPQADIKLDVGNPTAFAHTD